MEKSGWEPAEIASGLYGPYSQIGLVWAKVDASARAAKIKKKNAPVLAMKYGYIGAPTTFVSVRPLPGIWVCFWWNMMNMWAPISAANRPGISSTCRMYIRGMMSVPGYWPPNRKNDR